MLKMILDTNVLLDYFSCMTTQQDHQNALNLISELSRRETPFLITPTILKDSQYFISVELKKMIRSDKGVLTHEDAANVKIATITAIEHILELCCVASEDAASCEMARVLSEKHYDYEDNLISAVALRVDATCIVTRDKAFAKHCPVACFTPEQALSYLTAGIWDETA